jgi:copper transport protein
LALGLLWVLLAAAPAAAHAQLVSTTPANGQRLAVGPSEIRLRFSERVSPVRDGLRLLDSGRTARGIGPARLGPEADEVVLPVSEILPDGVYTLTWRVVSGDSHPIHGAFVFSVGDAVAVPLSAAGSGTDADPTLATVFVAFRWLGYAGLALLGGGVLFLVLCWPAGWDAVAARRTLLVAWTVSIFSAAAVLVLEGPYGAGAGLSRVFDPALLSSTVDAGYGRFVLARLAILVMGGLAVVAAGRGIRRTVTAPVAAVLLGVALPATWAGTGHAAGDLTAMAVDTVHLVAMCTWLGGLALLFGAVLRRGPRPLNEVATATTRFSPIAIGCVAVLVATGTYQAWRRVGSIDALADSGYGRLLLFKVAAIGLLLWLGALSNSAVRRGYLRATRGDAQAVSRSRRRAARTEERQEAQVRAGLRRSVRAEVAIAAAVLGVTSVLVSTPPGARAQAPPAVVAQTVDVDLPLTAGGHVRVTIDPPVVGASALAVAVRDKAGADWDVPEVKAALELPQVGLGPLPVALDRLRAGRFASRSLTLPAAGTWRLRISVRSSEIDEETVVTDVAVT